MPIDLTAERRPDAVAQKVKPAENVIVEYKNYTGDRFNEWEQLEDYGRMAGNGVLVKGDPSSEPKGGMGGSHVWAVVCG